MSKRKLALIAFALTFLCSVSPHAPRLPLPHLVLWAWERPEDLRFIDSATTAVAYLAATVTLQPDGSPRFQSRHQPLLTPPETTRIAVIRIESPPRYIFPDPSVLAVEIAQLAASHRAAALQIDFDARVSERAFYKFLLAKLRQNTNLPIGITALASWCEGDRWLDDLPISEAVPMFFRMGRNESRGMPVVSPVCRTSIGLSTDEPWPAPRAVRTYVFNPRSWTKSGYEAIRSRAEVWK